MSAPRIAPRTAPWLPLVSGLLLCACVDLSQPGTTGPSAIRVNEDLVLGLPAGYCVNKAASRIAEQGSSFLLGRCSDASRAVPALVRLTVGPPGSAAAIPAEPTGVLAFLTSRQGLASLSPTGRPGDIRLVTLVRQKDDFLMRIASRGEGDYWRAIAGIKGRLVTVSAIGTAEVPLDHEDSRTIIEATLAAHRKANQ